MFKFFRGERASVGVRLKCSTKEINIYLKIISD